ncbi:hypothetical protein MMM2322_00348 [Microbacterium sp. MM2322]
MYLAETLASEVAQPAAELVVLPLHDVGGNATVGAHRVPLDGRGFGHVEHDRDRQHVGVRLREFDERARRASGCTLVASTTVTVSSPASRRLPATYCSASNVAAVADWLDSWLETSPRNASLESVS